jgi:hypothetical protein
VTVPDITLNLGGNEPFVHVARYPRVVEAAMRASAGIGAADSEQNPAVWPGGTPAQVPA